MGTFELSSVPYHSIGNNSIKGHIQSKKRFTESYYSKGRALAAVVSAVVYLEP